MAPNNPLDSQFNSWVGDLLAEWKVPGMSLAVIDGTDVFAEVES